MKLKLLIALLFVTGLASAQIPEANDTTLYSGSTPFTPQFRFKNVTLSGVNYRIPQVYNSLLGKYDTYITSKYLRAFYAPLSGSGNYIQNGTSAQAANFNIAGTGATRRATVDTLMSRSSRTIVLRDTLQTNRPVHFFDSVGAFHQLGNLFKTQALKIYGNVELYSNAVGTLGRDLDFVKSRAGGPPVIGDEYGYINWRAPDSTGNALPAVQMIGRVAGHVGTNYNLGNLEFKVRSSAAYPGNTLLELTHDQKVNVEGNLRVGMGATGFTDFDSQAGLINGNLGLFGNNTDRSVDIVKQVAGGLPIGTTVAGVDGYGKTTTAGLQRMSFIKTFAGDNTTASVLTGKIKFAVQNASGNIDTALTIDDNANVNVKHNLFIPSNGFMVAGPSITADPYMGAYLGGWSFGTANSERASISNAGNFKINNLAGTGTRMVTASSDGTLGVTAIPSGGGGGSVITVGVASANGFGGSSDGDADNPALTLTSTLNTPVLASNGTALVAATTTGSGSTAVLNNNPTITGSTDVLNLAATGASGYTTYKSATSTSRGFIGNGSSVLTGASDSDFIIRSEGALKFANGNSKGAEVTTSGVGVPVNSSFYWGTPSDEYIASDGSIVTIGVNNSGVVNVSASGVAVTGNIAATGGLANGVTATTQSAGDSTSLVATDAFVKRAVATAFVSGQYTPTLTNVANVTSSAPIVCNYTRVGNVVTVHGSVTITPTSTGQCQIRLTLPISSNIGAATDLSGVGGFYDDTVNVTLQGDATNDAAVLRFFIPTTAAGQTAYFNYSYQVI